MNPLERFRFWDINQNSIIWKELRDPENELITASQVANIFGHGYSSRIDYYTTLANKCKVINENENEFLNRFLNHGIENEWLAKQSFRELFPSAKIVTPGFVFHPKIPYLGASLDAVGLDLDSNNVMPLFVLETKCPFKARPKSVNDIKINYIIQIMVQMSCTGIKCAFLHYWYIEEGKEFVKTFYLPFDEDLERYILAGVINFKENLDANIAPPKRQKKDKRFLELIELYRQKISTLL